MQVTDAEIPYQKYILLITAKYFWLELFTNEKIMPWNLQHLSQYVYQLSGRNVMNMDNVALPLNVA